MEKRKNIFEEIIMVKIVIRKNHSTKIFNDEKEQINFDQIIKDSMKDNKKLLDRLAEDD